MNKNEVKPEQQPEVNSVPKPPVIDLAVVPNAKSSDVKLDPSETKVPLSQKRDQAENPFRMIYNYIWSNQTRKTYTLLTLTFAFLAVLILFAISPTINSIAQIYKKIEEYRVIKVNQERKISNLLSLQSQAENTIQSGGLYEYIKFFDQTFFPKDLKDEDIYKDMIDKSGATGVTLSSVRSNGIDNSTTNFDRVKGYKFQINIQSKDQEKIQSMINALKKSSHYYHIDRVSIGSPINLTGTNKNTVGNDQYNAVINLTAYYYV